MMSTVLLRLAINRLPMLRPHEKTLLEEIVDSETFFHALTVGLLSQIVGRSIRDVPLDARSVLDLARRDAEFLRARSIAAIPVGDTRYPALLREIFDPPYLIYVRGTLPDGAIPSVAVVGTREPTAAAVAAARELGAGIARRGMPVISGLARGIDIAAHRGALSTGTTGAVLACGIDQVCPTSHRSVAAMILARGGFLISEYAPGVAPQKYHFPARNRIISGMARGVVVVQAPSRSGALITADYALDHGRDLFVHAAGIDGVSGAGTRDLATDGAMIVGSVDDICAEWGILPAGASRTGRLGAIAEMVDSDDVARSIAARTRAELESELRRTV